MLQVLHQRKCKTLKFSFKYYVTNVTSRNRKTLEPSFKHYITNVTSKLNVQ
jgi:hypothetical protein